MKISLIFSRSTSIFLIFRLKINGNTSLYLMVNSTDMSVEFTIKYKLVLPLIFSRKIRKMLVDLLKISEIFILVDFLSFFEKSVEFFVLNTDWETNLP